MIKRYSLIGRVLCSPFVALLVVAILGYMVIGGAGVIIGGTIGFIFMKAITD